MYKLSVYFCHWNTCLYYRVSVDHDVLLLNYTYKFLLAIQLHFKIIPFIRPGKLDFLFPIRVLAERHREHHHLMYQLETNKTRMHISITPIYTIPCFKERYIWYNHNQLPTGYLQLVQKAYLYPWIHSDLIFCQWRISNRQLLKHKCGQHWLNDQYVHVTDDLHNQLHMLVHLIQL